jgi:acyl carrier protein
MTQLEERLQVMANETFGMDIEAMRDGKSFVELGIDSLALIEFTLDLQREFDVPMDEGEVRADFTIASTAELLAAKGAAA